jgi:hypothetical protein
MAINALCTNVSNRWINYFIVANTIISIQIRIRIRFLTFYKCWNWIRTQCKGKALQTSEVIL